MAVRRTGPNNIVQAQNLDDSGAQKTSSVLSVGMLYSEDISDVKEIGTENVLRVTITTETFLAFSDDSDDLAGETPSATTAAPFFCIRLASAGTYDVAAPAKFVKASTNPTRIELIK